MNRKILLLVIVCSLAAPSMAQVSLSVQVPSTGVIQKAQLWNVLLVNTSDDVVQISVHLSLLSTEDNTPVLTGISRTILLSKGAKQITWKECTPVQYNYYSTIITDRNPEGFLPIGNFYACYVIYAHYGERQVQMGEDCVPVEISPTTPPLLNMPFDASVLETEYPQFSWLPPSPLQLFSNLSYDVIVVEVMQGQSTTEAIQKNIPRYFASEQRVLYHNYPASYAPLDTAKTYAWRVIAKNAGRFVAQSEVWTFKVHKQILTPLVPKNGKYMLIKQGETQGVHIVEGNVLGIKFYSFDKLHETVIRFFDAKGELIKEIAQKIVYGDNYLAYLLNKDFDKDKTYSVEITDRQGNKHAGFFRMHHN